MNESRTLIALIRPDRRDDVIVRTMRSTVNRQLRESVSDHESGSVEGSTLPGGVEGMDQSRATEARNLERFSLKAGFEAPATRFRGLESGGKTE